MPQMYLGAEEDMNTKEIEHVLFLVKNTLIELDEAKSVLEIALEAAKGTQHTSNEWELRWAGRDVLPRLQSICEQYRFDGKLVAAVKAVRELTGYGLKESKALVESW